MNTLILLTALGMLSLFSEIFNFKKILLPMIYVGLASAIILAVCDWNTNESYFNNMIVFDNFALSFTILLATLSLLWFAISPSFFHEPTSSVDHISLILFTLIGAVVMTSYSNMIMLFLGIEILSISIYVLAGSRKSSLESNEAALKYFLMGAFATCFLLFGIALVYGSTGTFNIDRIGGAIMIGSNENNMLLYAGVLMIMIALAFKVSAVPFHFWAPDVYQGSPTVITAFMSTVVKTAAFAAFLRIMTAFISLESFWSATLWIITAATILVGNITAVYQKNMKRMLAYSSVAHAGYMLLAILAMNNSSADSLLFYAIAYSVSSITSFAILLVVHRATGSESIESFYGLAKRNPLLATVTVISMLSLAGIPPTAGFFAKYYIFSSAIQNNLTALVLIAIIGSLIGVFYYFRVIIALFRDNETQKIEMGTAFQTVLLFTSFIAMLLGILPGLFVGII